MTDEKFVQGTLNEAINEVKKPPVTTLGPVAKPIQEPPFLEEPYEIASRRDDSIHRGAQLTGGKRRG